MVQVQEGVAVGRIVHYVARGSADGKFPSVCRAAVITEIDKITIQDAVDEIPKVGLCVLNPTGMFFDQHVPYAAAGTGNELVPGTWHWPERK